MRRKLIEVALPLDGINKASQRERYLRIGHPSTFHQWWARRPLASARAIIFASLVDDPDNPYAPVEFVEACRKLNGKDFGYANKNVERFGDTPRMRLFDFIEKLVTWEATFDERIVAKARELIDLSTGGDSPYFIDPFAGGGTMPLEAARLGLKVEASDLNPVATLINKAQLEIPYLFFNHPPVNPEVKRQLLNLSKWKNSSGLACDVEYYGKLLIDRVHQKVAHLYPTYNGEQVYYWVWVRAIKSPDPSVDAYVPLTFTFAISTRKGQEHWARPFWQNGQLRFQVERGLPPSTMQGTMIPYKGGRCLITGSTITYDYIREEARNGRIKNVMMAVVTKCNGRYNFYSPDEHQIRVAESAEYSDALDAPTPDDAIGYRVQNYGVYNFRDYFSPRQFTMLIAFSDTIRELYHQIKRDALSSGMADDTTPLREGGRGAEAYAQAITVYLSMASSKVISYNNAYCARKVESGSRPTGLFMRQAISMMWDHTETNPFNGAAGSIKVAISMVVSNIKNFTEHPCAIATARDAREISNGAPALIVTDPPYYDMVGYSALSDFFYVWHRRVLADLYPELFSTILTSKSNELVANPKLNRGNSQLAKMYFENGMLEVFNSIRDRCHPDYPVSIYYAYRQSASKGSQSTQLSAWETMLSGLIKSGMSIVATYPIRTEMKGRTSSQNKNSLSSSIILVCRRRSPYAPSATKRQFLTELRKVLSIRINDLLSSGISSVDLAQSCVGVGMEVYSRYSQVRDADGNPVDIRYALQLINSSVDEILLGDLTDFDAETRLALGWLERYGFEYGDTGELDVLARSKNTSLETMQKFDLAHVASGKAKLKYWSEPIRFDLARQTVWGALHCTIKIMKEQGEVKASAFKYHLNPTVGGEITRLAHILHAICERNGWQNHAIYYNAIPNLPPYTDKKSKCQSDGEWQSAIPSSPDGIDGSIEIRH